MATVKKSAPKKGGQSKWNQISDSKIPRESCVQSEIPEPKSEYDHDAYLLKQANDQIRNLKERNKHQALRLDMFDKVYNLFMADNGRGRACDAEDSGLEWQIQRRLDEKSGKSFNQL